jgi:hypothetical protein
MMQIFYILSLILNLVGLVISGGCYRKPYIYSTNVETAVKVVLISDTHGLHEHLELPKKMDVLIHSGFY